MMRSTAVLLLVAMTVGALISLVVASRPLADYPAGYQLRNVQVVMRHGARTPIDPVVPPTLQQQWDCKMHLAGITSQDDSPRQTVDRLYRKVYMSDMELQRGNCGAGMLTSTGAAQQQALGASLRSVYVDQLGFLPSQYDPSVVYIRSTDIQRTQESAMNHILGLFPPSSSAGTSYTEMLTINTCDLGNDILLAHPESCPALSSEMERLRNTTTYVNYMNQVRPVEQRLKQQWQIPSSSNWDWASSFSLVQCLDAERLSMPPGVDAATTQTLNEAATFEVNYFYTTTLARRLGFGRLLSVLLGNMRGMQNGSNKYKYQLYSAHDTTVAPLLASLSVPSSQYPPFAAHVQLETFQTASNGWFVRVLSQGLPQVLPGCPGEFCPLDTFASIVQPLIPTNYAAECSMHGRHYAHEHDAATHPWTPMEGEELVAWA